MGVFLLTGCDVALGVGAAIYLSRDKDDDTVAAFPPPPDPTYHVWVATLTAAEATAQETALGGNGGNPDPGVWTDVGTATATAMFDPAAALTFNAVLIQASDAQNYEIDGVEALDPNGVVFETASGTVHFGRLLAGTEFGILGPPDGAAAVTEAVAGQKAFVFTLYSGTLPSFRVNAWRPGSRTSGDVEWTATWSDAGDETPGGAAADSTGRVFFTVNNFAGPDRPVRLLSVTPAGLFTDHAAVETITGATAGSHSVAVDAANDVYVATTFGPGDVKVMKFDDADLMTPPPPPPPAAWTFDVSFLLTQNRVESNSIAVMSDGHLVVAGGLNSGVGTGLDHWMIKVNAGTGAQIGSTETLSSDTTASYWHGVAAGPSQQVYTAGDFESLASGVKETFTRKATFGGGAFSQNWGDTTGDNQDPDDRVVTVGVAPGAADPAVVSGGYLESAVTGEGRNAVLRKLTKDASPVFLVTYVGPGGGPVDGHDDEILDLAVDTDETLYAVGYETVEGQNKNMWVRKLTADGVPLWTRTYHGGGGEDRAVSVVLSGSAVIVVGFRTDPTSGEKDIHVRAYRK